jgi:hypothetical protein
MPVLDMLTTNTRLCQVIVMLVCDEALFAEYEPRFRPLRTSFLP